MVRKQFYITADQERKLKLRAKALDVPEAEVVRQGIDLAVSSGVRPSFDSRVWEKEMRFIRKRMRMRVPQTGRGWTRDELYDERFERFAR
jgi:hypothetical protein